MNVKLEELKSIDSNLVHNIKAILSHTIRYKQFPKDWYAWYDQDFKSPLKLTKQDSVVKIRQGRHHPSSYILKSSNLYVNSMGVIRKLEKGEYLYVLNYWSVYVSMGDFKCEIPVKCFIDDTK